MGVLVGGERLREARGIGIFLPALGNRSVDSPPTRRARALSEGCGGGANAKYLNVRHILKGNYFQAVC